MIKPTPIILFLILILNVSLFGQKKIHCDSISNYSVDDFKTLLQEEYQSIKADTVLAIRHCYTTNGCFNTFGLLCWKTNGHFYFKKIYRNDVKVKMTARLERKLNNSGDYSDLENEYKRFGRKYERKNRKSERIKITSKLNKKIRKHLIDFFNKEIYTRTGNVDSQLFPDDGPFTLVLFKTTEKCWRFSMQISGSNDIRVAWTNELLQLINK